MVKYWKNLKGGSEQERKRARRGVSRRVKGRGRKRYRSDRPLLLLLLSIFEEAEQLSYFRDHSIN